MDMRVGAARMGMVERGNLRLGKKTQEGEQDREREATRWFFLNVYH
jgi:hypothetical protein